MAVADRHGLPVAVHIESATPHEVKLAVKVGPIPGFEHFYHWHKIAIRGLIHRGGSFSVLFRVGGHPAVPKSAWNHKSSPSTVKCWHHIQSICGKSQVQKSEARMRTQVLGLGRNSEDG